jgi:hypothetical protein
MARIENSRPKAASPAASAAQMAEAWQVHVGRAGDVGWVDAGEAAVVEAAAVVGAAAAVVRLAEEAGWNPSTARAKA